MWTLAVEEDEPKAGESSAVSASSESEDEIITNIRSSRNVIYSSDDEESEKSISEGLC